MESDLSRPHMGTADRKSSVSQREMGIGSSEEETEEEEGRKEEVGRKKKI